MKILLTTSEKPVLKLTAKTNTALPPHDDPVKPPENVGMMTLVHGHASTAKRRNILADTHTDFKICAHIEYVQMLKCTCLTACLQTST